MTENELSYQIIGCALDINKTISPGLLELGLNVKQQVPMPFIYKKVKQDVGYRLDLLINNKVIIEIKSLENLAPVHYAQTLTYLKLSDLKLALLINFNSKVLKDNIHRIVNNL
jgi:GxxExxY protein